MTPETIALDLEYHIRHIEQYARAIRTDPAVPIGVAGSLLSAVEDLNRARASLLDGLERVGKEQ